MSLPDASRHYINGVWAAPNSQKYKDNIDPSTEGLIGRVALGDDKDVEAAVKAARAAFADYAQTDVKERLGFLKKINEQLKERNDEIANAITQDMGAPVNLSRYAQATRGTVHFSEVIKVLEAFQFEEKLGESLVRHEPVGVCALITPWNWPLNQIATKVAPALAAGCTMVLKPTELAPLAGVILADIIDKAGVPAGVFNMVHGEGEVVGNALTSHRDIDMISFTGSTRAGIAISKNAAPDIKRVALELGGKSANIILDDADLTKAVPGSVFGVMNNTGQSCNAPTRLLVPKKDYDEIVQLAVEATKAVTVGAATQKVKMGPIANKTQYDRVLTMMKKGIDEGADLLVGGSAKPEGLEQGYFVAPTIFGNVTGDMTIAREEIFGPVLSIMTYETEDEAIEIANDSEYGLSGYVWGSDPARIKNVASKLRTGMVHVNGALPDPAAPFGGYKKSGNGREWGVYGLHEFLEVKSIYGGAVAPSE